MELEAAKMIGAGLAAIALAGAGVGIGLIFGIYSHFKKKLYEKNLLCIVHSYICLFESGFWLRGRNASIKP